MALKLLVSNVEKNYFEKQPSEKINITINFNNELGSNGSISDHRILAYNSSGTSVGTSVLAGSSETGGIVTIGLKGGTDGETYTITSKVTSDLTLPDGDPVTFEADVKMKVKEDKFY